MKFTDQLATTDTSKLRILWTSYLVNQQGRLKLTISGRALTVTLLLCFAVKLIVETVVQS